MAEATDSVHLTKLRASMGTAVRTLALRAKGSLESKLDSSVKNRQHDLMQC
jgi:hypothetical protein